MTTLPGFEETASLGEDVVITPDRIAKAIVNRFQPAGQVLDPCCGDGAFLQFMPGADWCEIRKGRDFFEWKEPVDWIVSNPPYSIFSDFLRHAFAISENIVFLVPVNKAFNSDALMRDIWKWGGIKTCMVIGSGSSLRFPIGFCIGALHFERGYKGGMNVEFL